MGRGVLSSLWIQYLSILLTEKGATNGQCINGMEFSKMREMSYSFWVQCKRYTPKDFI